MADVPAEKAAAPPAKAKKEEPKALENVLFAGPSGAYVLGVGSDQVTFEKDGVSHQVSAEVAEQLLSLNDQTFEIATPEQVKAEKAAVARAVAEAEAAEKSAAEAQAKLDRDAKKRGIYYGAISQAEIDAMRIEDELETDAKGPESS